MMLKLILLFFVLKISYKSATASRKGHDIDNTSSKVKEITVAIEQNSHDGDLNSSNDPNRKSSLQRTRTNLLLNSKLIYPSGSKRASAFNQGILKFQQLLDLPIDTNATETEKIMNSSGEDSRSIEIPKHNETMEHKGNCGGSSEEDADNKVLKKKFIEDFGTVNIDEAASSSSDDEEFKKKQEATTTTMMPINKTQEVETITPIANKNDTRNETKIEILDDDNEINVNKTAEMGKKNETSFTQLKGETSFTQLKGASQKTAEEIEVKPQLVEEIALNPNHKKSAKKTEQEEQDEISQNIKRDILLGNLNPFFTNPSTSSIRNTNSVFFDDDTKSSKSAKLTSSFNPFAINSFASNTIDSDVFRKPSRLRSRTSKTAAVETLPSIPLGNTNAKSSFKLRNSAKTTVRTVPSIQRQETRPKYSSRYRNRPTTAVSSASFSITPSLSSSKPRGGFQGTKTRNFPAVNRPVAAPKTPLASSSENVEVVKSVDYSLPEEVGKSLTKTGPAKFKRKVGFESNGYPDESGYELQKSLHVDPLTVNLDMSQKKQELYNPYLVNTQIRNSNVYKFKPSIADTKTRKIREFYTNFDASSFQPVRTEDVLQYDAPGTAEEYEEFQEQPIKNFESDMIFKPYFVTQSPKMFEMPETTLKYTTKQVHMIDLSNF